MAGDLNVAERAVWTQSAAASGTQAGGGQAALGAQAPVTAALEKGERMIHRYGRLGIAATTGGAASAQASGGAAAASAPAPASLTEVERHGLAALQLRESAEYKNVKANRPRAGEAWDMHNCTTIVATPPTAHTAALGVTGAPGAPGAQAGGPTSSYLEGSVAVGIVIVQGPTNDLKFSNDETAKVVAEVQNGLSFYGTQHPSGELSFTYDIQNVTLTKNADPNLDPSLMEPYFRDPTMAALGYSPDWNGVVNYVETIRTRFGTRWTYCAFFTKYPTSWFAYASIGGPRLVMQYSNDGWGPDNIDRVFAHESGHIFGCPDEYASSGCDCGGAWGRWGMPNANCENCAPNGGVPCLMKNNDFQLCTYTPDHLGWIPRLLVRNFGYNAGGWRVDKHPRFMADTTGDKRADLVGFGEAGVWVCQAQASGTLGDPVLRVNNFGYSAGGWRVDQHPRFVVDTTGDGRADVVGFGSGGVWIAKAQPDGTFTAPQLVVANFGYDAGGWRVDKHPRFIADTTGSKRGDIVGFGEGGVWVSVAKADGTYGTPTLVVANFGYSAGGWRVDQHPRFVADTTGDGRADIVGFGSGGVWISRAQANGTFSAPQLVVANFGYDAGGWRVDKHPRFVVDITGDGRADIVGFGEGGVWVSLAKSDGTYSAPTLVVANFGYTAGGWRVDKHPRLLADTTGDGLPDIVGYGEAGVWVSRNTGGGTFAAPTLLFKEFGYSSGWRIDRHVRFMADVNGDGKSDMVGCGDAGVYVALISQLLS